MKRSFRKIIFLLIMVISASFVFSACGNASDPTQVVVKYIADDGGDILVYEISRYEPYSSKELTLTKGSDCVPVIASVYDGYVFTGWSDGVTDEYRLDENVRSDMTVTAHFEKLIYSAEYIAGINGKISGKTIQNIPYGDSIEEIEAVPDANYMFTGWSDGVMTAKRKDKITKNLSVTATFEKLNRTFLFDYHYATGNNTDKDINVHIDRMDTMTFPVPEKEFSTFGGWYADRERSLAITDDTGNLLIGKNVFTADTDTLYAKWTAQENITYDILLVFVTEIKATLRDKYGNPIDVDYRLSPAEQKVCELIPLQLEKYLNELFYGYITFNVDAYFTQETVTTECFSQSTARWGDHSLFAYEIPETAYLTKGYRSILTTFALNDYHSVLHPIAIAGLAGSVHGCVYLDSELWTYRPSLWPEHPWLGLDTTIDVFFEVDNPAVSWHWDQLISTYLHELTHTIEMSYQCNDYHTVDGQSGKLGITTLELTKLYLLNQAPLNGKRAGVPHDFWVGNVIVGVVHWANTGGRITSAAEIKGVSQHIQEIPFGSDSEAVTAVPEDGYRFVKWSDGILNPTRSESNVVASYHVWAIFEPVE